MASDTGSFTENLGGAVSDIFGAIGDEQAAAAYGKEAVIAGENAAISQTSGKIQEAQTARQVTQAIGTQEANIEAGGFTMGGNASDLLRQSMQQGSLAKSLVTQQAAITTLGFQEQQQAAQGKASASKTAGIGGFLGGAIKIAGLFSDRRLKEDIVFLRKIGEFNIYSYRYIGDDTTRIGVMADEVEKIMPEAVTVDAATGFKKVNYSLLGLDGV